jgi:signal transduction histidine kinase
MVLAVRAFGLAGHTGRVNALRIPSLLLVLMVGALPGSLLSAWVHVDTTHQTILTLDVVIRCLSAVLTVVALCPLVLGLLRGFDEPIAAPAGPAERISIGVAFALLCLVYFAVPWSLDRFLELMLLAGPLLWLALRCSHQAAATVCAAVAIGIGVACAHGIGRFPALVGLGTWRDGILSAQVFLLLTCTEILLINWIVLKQRALLEDSQRKQVMLAAYGRALDDAEDSARRAAARDLHDGVAQIIAGQSMILGALRRRMRESELHELLDQAIAASREAQSAVRATIEDLSPPEVDRASAQEILSWLREYFSQRYRFTVDWRIPGDQCVDHGQSRLIYKAVRELIYNAYKHAETDSVRVELSADAAGTVVSVFDDGVGFDPHTPAQDGRQRHGLTHLAERLAVVHGQLDIRSSVGHGCTVTLFLPAQKPGARTIHPQSRDATRETISVGRRDSGALNPATESTDAQT